ncbi:ATP-binding protein [Candidatus Magnetominusculus dajiuhuensis]|uniref:sensor histidine kinase n=1 Tax=Candidatus Magnetominusculus dajiuhuensis TaxID=3137712 RepID=UPI003B4389C3
MERQISESFALMLASGLKGIHEEFEFSEQRLLDSVRQAATEGGLVKMAELRDGKALLSKLPNLKALLAASDIRVYDHEGLMLADGYFREPLEGERGVNKDMLARVLKGEDVSATIGDEDGIEFAALAQIRAKGELVGVLEVTKHLDYDLLTHMKNEFGVEIIVYNGDLPQATTIMNNSVFSDSNLKTLINKVNTQQRQIDKEMAIGGVRCYVAAKPMELDNGRTGVIVVAMSGEKTYRQRMILKIAAPLSVVILLLISFYVSRRVSLKVVEPIKTLCKVAQEISEGSGSASADIKSDDEVGVLADSFNKMIKELRMHQDHLNELVGEKTSELIETNAELLNEMVERKRAQAQRELTMNLLQNISDNVPGAIYQFRLHPDGSSCFPYASAAFRDIYRITPEEVRDDASRVFTVLHPDEHDDFLASIRKSATDLTHWHYEALLVFDDGTTRWALNSAMPQREGDGSVIWHGFVMDVTRRKQLEEELLELNRTLEQRVEDGISKIVYQKQMLIQQSKMAAMGEMIGLIAHQWRQPLNAIGLNVQDLKDAYDFGELDEKSIKQVVDITMDQINFMSKTIDDFKNFFKPSKMKLRFDVKKNIEEIFSMFQQVFVKARVDVSIKSVHDALLFTEGYPNEFKQVILNILNNSKDAISSKRDNSASSPTRGQIEIAIENSEQRDKIIISIRDNGGGIPEDIIGKIFDHYFSTKGQEGTGLGLYMSKTIVETNMGGTLTVRNVGDGAEFMISLDVEPHTQEDS